MSASLILFTFCSGGVLNYGNVTSGGDDRMSCSNNADLGYLMSEFRAQIGACGIWALIFMLFADI